MIQNATKLNDNRPIGIIDSGIGGLTVLEPLVKDFKHENFIYVGDSLNVPYGNRDAHDIVALSLKMIEYLLKQNIKVLVIACNTITIAALDEISKLVNIPVVGMSRGVKLALKNSKNKNIGVMATQMTINSHVHQREIHKIDNSANVIEKACPELATMIERNKIDEANLKSYIKPYIDEFVAANVDTVIYGCTHFPFIDEVANEIAGDQIKFLNPASEMIAILEKTLDDIGKATESEDRNIELFFTKDSQNGVAMAYKLMPEFKFTSNNINL